jgi:acetyl-CoA carboxylase biotin carboxyl carrier protein
MADDAATIDTHELLALIDRLEVLLQASQLAEIEVEAGGTALVLRSPAAIAPPPAMTAASAPPATSAPAESAAHANEDEQAPRTLAVLAPLTGLYYGSPSPGADPYVRAGSEVAVGQVIGLIEAMKLFNEIKSDAAGRVVRICVDDGGLVKAKQPLIELAPI